MRVSGMPGNAEHLSPAVIRRIDGGYASRRLRRALRGLAQQTASQKRVIAPGFGIADTR